MKIESCVPVSDAWKARPIARPLCISNFKEGVVRARPPITAEERNALSASVQLRCIALSEPKQSAEVAEQEENSTGKKVMRAVADEKTSWAGAAALVLRSIRRTRAQ